MMSRDKSKEHSLTNETIEMETRLNNIEAGFSTRTSDKQTSVETQVEDSDGGFWAWATVLSAFIIQSTGFGYANAFGVYQDFYVRDFLTSSTSSQISWIGSTQTFLMLTMGLFTGPLFDKGYCYHLIGTGSVLLVVSLFLLSLAKPEHYYQVFLAQGLGAGIGSSLSYLPSLAVLAHHFRQPHNRARAMGIAVAGSSLGGLLHPIMLNYLFHGSSDTRASFARGVRASAGLVAGLQAIAVALLRTKYPKRIKSQYPNERVDELQEISTDNDHEKRPVKPSVLFKKFASDWPYVFFVFGMTLYEVVFFFPSFYLQLDAIKHGLDSTFAFYSLSILNGSSFFGRLMPGFFARPFGVANMFVFSTFGSTVVIFCMIAVKTVAGVSIFAAFYGFLSGSFITLMSPMLALLAEGPAEIGARMGMCFAFSGVGSLIGTPIAGALLTSSFIWWRPIIFSGTLCVIGFAAFALCRIILGQRKDSLWII